MDVDKLLVLAYGENGVRVIKSMAEYERKPIGYFVKVKFRKRMVSGIKVVK